MGYAREFPKHLCAYDLCLRALLLGGLVRLMVALAACGGGSGGDGSGGGNTNPPNTTATPPSVLMATPKPPAPGWQSDAAKWAEHRGYRQQFGLAMINASAAYAAGATGTGVIIGFVDTGLAENHAAFDGKQIMVNDRTGLRDGATPRQGVLFSARDLPLSSGSRPLQLGMRYGGDRLVWAVQAETVNGEMAHIGAKLRRVF